MKLKDKQTHNSQYLFVNVDMDGNGNQLAAMEYYCYVLFVLYLFYANCMQIKFIRIK